MAATTNLALNNISIADVSEANRKKAYLDPLVFLRVLFLADHSSFGFGTFLVAVLDRKTLFSSKTLEKFFSKLYKDYLLYSYAIAIQTGINFNS